MKWIMDRFRAIKRYPTPPDRPLFHKIALLPRFVRRVIAQALLVETSLANDLQSLLPVRGDSAFKEPAAYAFPY
jgi:hypothetical protein